MRLRWPSSVTVYSIPQPGSSHCSGPAASARHGSPSSSATSSARGSPTGRRSSISPRSPSRSSCCRRSPGRSGCERPAPRAGATCWKTSYGTASCCSSSTTSSTSSTARRRSPSCSMLLPASPCSRRADVSFGWLPNTSSTSNRSTETLPAGCSPPERRPRARGSTPTKPSFARSATGSKACRWRSS